MKKMKKLMMATLLSLTTTAAQVVHAQVISFSMEEEAASKNSPEGWTEVKLPTNLPAFTEDNTFYITDAKFGASTSSADNTSAIQAALDAAYSAGGGMVVIPEGTFLCNTLKVGSKTVLHLCKNATLKWLSYSDRSHTEGNIFITNRGSSATYSSDIVIEGEGPTSVLEGQGQEWWDNYKESGMKRGGMIRFNKGQRFLFRNFRIQNAPGVNLTLGNSGGGSNNTVHDIQIYAPASSHNTDGIPIWSQYANIYNCTIDTGDDNVVCDSYARNIHVWKCTMKAGHGASLGSFTQNMHDIIYEDLTFEGTDCGFRLKSNNDRSGDVYNIIFRNCTMTNVASPISITCWYDLSYDKLDPETIEAATETMKSTTPKYHDILIQNVTASGYNSKNSNNKSYNAVYIYGRPESFVKDVTFENVNISHRNGVRLFFCEGIKFVNCTIEKTRTKVKATPEDKDLGSVMENSYKATYTWDKSSTGIASLTATPLKRSDNIYTLRGDLVKANATDADLQGLRKGIYFYNQRKIIVK